MKSGHSCCLYFWPPLLCHCPHFSVMSESELRSTGLAADVSARTDDFPVFEEGKTSCFLEFVLLQSRLSSTQEKLSGGEPNLNNSIIFYRKVRKSQVKQPKGTYIYIEKKNKDYVE